MIGALHRRCPVDSVALTADAASSPGSPKRAGAVGYVLKDGQADELPLQVRAAAAGEIPLAPKVAACVVQEVRARRRQ
jgi:DNA-binding NarL/FixJ family response regulator